MRTHTHDAEQAIDASYLSTFLGFDAADLEHLATAPTVDLVDALLRSVLSKASEFDSLKTEKLKLDVEYNGAVLAADKKVAVQKSTITRQSRDMETLRKELSDATAAKEGLESQLGASKGAASDSVGEVETLRARVESLESSKRDALALLDSRSTEKDRLHEELNEQHGKLVTLRREFSELEQKKQSLDSLTSAQKFKESSLRQEVELMRKTNEWQEGELRTTSQEHSKFRKERNLTINKLQRELEDANATIEALQASETTLKQRFNNLENKLTETFDKHAESQQDHVRSEQSLREQIESSKRLAELQAQNAAVHKAQVQSLQTQVEELREEASLEIGKLQGDVDVERAEREQAERRLAELEVELERMQRQPRPSAPSTPLPNGSPRLLDVTKNSRAITQTQLYGQYVEAKEELAREERRCAKLQAALDELIQDMESKAPELVEMRQEQDRLEAEVLSFSRLLDEASTQRDNATRDAARWQHESSAISQEADILRQQLRDVSAQVKILLVEIQSRDQGLAEMTVQERLELERAARGENDQLALQDASTTQTLISERLVIFRSVAELQQQNEQLLRLTRTLGEKMEGEEAQEQARKSAAQISESNELRAQVERYKDELQATATQIDSYMKERDMFRRMLQHRGTLGANTDTGAMFGSSIPPATPQRNGDFGEPRAKELDELNRLLKEQQSFFDQFRQESTSDRSLLKNQIDSLIRERSSLQADVGRLDSQLGLASQRYELLQSNFSSLRTENSALQQRSQNLLEAAAKHDSRAQQLVEESMEARSLAETLRNESATTKAEKDLWKRIEGRLTEDNQALIDERGRLSKLVTDLQTLANERELSENEARRRLQTRSDQLEAELAETKRKLDIEVEQSKKSSMRKEYEESQSRTRIDDLVKSLSTAREELASARTARDQLQTRVEEMRIDLRAAQDKVVTLQQPHNVSAIMNSNTASGQSNGDINGSADLTAEQRLSLQITDLRRELERANNELVSTKEQIEQYKTIAQSTEEELLNFNRTTDEYREETDKLLAEKDASVQQLEQRIQDLSAELTTTNAELSDLRTRHDEASKSVQSDRAALESELARLRDDQDRHAQEKELYQQDLKAQAEIAQQAQQSYESELLKHADAARQLQTARQERESLREEVIAARKDVQLATSRFNAGEESWTEQKERLEAEMLDLRRRKSDGDGQIKVLHQQLETFSAELQALRQGRAAAVDTDNAAAGSDSKMQEVVTYLRREKEIIEVQYELAANENKRMQQQLDHTQNQLESVQLKLAEERAQGNQRATNEVSTTRLAQAIDELNLFRESAVTLRNEAKQAKEKLDIKTQEVERLQAELEPLRSELGKIEAELEAKDDEVKLIMDDRDHWRDRTQSIISKYDRVDPAELEELRTRIAELEKQRDEALAAQETLRRGSESIQQQLDVEKQTLREANEALQKQLVEQDEAAQKTLTERLDKFKEQAKEQNRVQRGRTTEATTKFEAAQAEVVRLQQELDEHKQNPPAADTATTETADIDQKLQQQLEQANAEVVSQTGRGDELQVRVNELELQLSSLSAEIEQLKAAASSQDQEQGEIVEPSEQTVQLEAVRQQLAEAQKEIEQLQAQAAITQAAANQAAPQTSTEANGGEAGGDAELPELTDEQVNTLMKRNERVRSIVGKSIKKTVGRETERLSKAIADKDEEIAKLKESTKSATDGQPDTDSAATAKIAVLEEEKQGLLKQVADAQQDKEAAVKQAAAQAIAQAEMKSKVQLSQRDMAQAKLTVIQQAVQETPQKPVKEVWEIAKNAKPQPKTAAPATGNAQQMKPEAAIFKPASGIPQPTASKANELTRGPGGFSVLGRGGAGSKRSYEGGSGHHNKRPKS